MQMWGTGRCVPVEIVVSSSTLELREGEMRLIAVTVLSINGKGEDPQAVVTFESARYLCDSSKLLVVKSIR